MEKKFHNCQQSVESNESIILPCIKRYSKNELTKAKKKGCIGFFNAKFIYIMHTRKP